ncbi:CobW family GTP-binding protein [Pseudomonas wadenswilerensis]
MSAAGDGRIPVTLLTGFLGSGKTTTLNRLLQQPALADAAVIINEFGEVGLDHLLVEQVSENLRLLQSGCICCTVRGDLVDTLVDLYERRRQQTLPAFSRVIIETTGLADPTAVLQTFMIDAWLLEHFTLRQVLTTVDAVNGARTLDNHSEAVQQVSLADRLLLTKIDLADAAVVDGLARRLADLNPGAQILPVLNGRVPLDDLLDDCPDRVRQIDAHVRRIEEGQRGGSHHDGEVRSHCLILDQPLEQARLAHWLELMAMVRGDSLLRVKGLVRLVEHPDRPTVIHGVQQIVHPLRQLAQWPSPDRRSRIVLIVRHIEMSEIRRTFEKFVGVTLPVLQPLALQRGAPHGGVMRPTAWT